MTLVDDTTLLGQPSLAAALDGHIRDAEVVVPVLDRKANSSPWVLRELEVAVNHKRLLLPVVQDPESLPSPIRDIPYLTEQNIDALVPAALARFALLPLDPAEPYQLSAEGLRKYLASGTDYVRVILDSDNLIGQLAEDTPVMAEQASQKRPDLQKSFEQQCRKYLDRAVRMMDQAQLALPRYRAALEAILVRWGVERAERVAGPFQRLLHLSWGLTCWNSGQVLFRICFRITGGREAKRSERRGGNTRKVPCWLSPSGRGDAVGTHAQP